MMMPDMARICDLIQPEVVTWRTINRPFDGNRQRCLSLKAVFWCAAAIVISLVLGNLT
jgi:hypothetical protein